MQLLILSSYKKIWKTLFSKKNPYFHKKKKKKKNGRQKSLLVRRDLIKCDINQGVTLPITQT